MQALPKLVATWTGPVKPGLAVHNQNPAGPNPSEPSPGASTVGSTSCTWLTTRTGPGLPRPRPARDTALAAGALRALGCAITESRTGWLIAPGQPTPGSAVSVDVGNAGT